MTNFADFTVDGTTDWEAYREAQIQAGEICCKCGRYLVFHKTGQITMCSSCKSIQESKESIQHDTYIRCPKCGNSYEALEFSEFDIFEEGEHDVDCPSCGYFFIVETAVSYNFTSPAVADEIEDDSDIEIDYTEEE